MSMYPDSPPTAPPTGPPTTPPAAPSSAPPPPAGAGGGAGPARPRTSSGNGRSIIGVILLLLAGVSATFGITSFWGEHEILDSNTWVATSKAIVNDPTVQKDVAHSIAVQVVDAVGVENLVQNSLPAPFNKFSGVLADQATNLLTTAAEKVVTTDAFVSVWEKAVRSVHDEFVHAVDGTSSVTAIGKDGLYLQVGPALEQVKMQLSKMGVPLLDRVDLSSIDVKVLLVDAPGLERIQTWVHVMRIGAIVFPAIAVIALIAGLLIAKRRSLAVIAGGVGILVGAGIVYLLLNLQSSRAIDEISGGLLGRASATVIVHHVTAGLEHALVISLIVGIGVAILGTVAFAMNRGLPSERSNGDDSTGGDTGAATA